MSLTPKLIKIIYCYLMCLFLVIYLILNGTSLISTLIDKIYFEETYITSHHLTKSEYANRPGLKHLSPDHIETLRQAEIREDKTLDLARKKVRLINTSISTGVALIFLFIHILIIHRSRHA